MSLLDEFKDDLDGLSQLLNDWMRGCTTASDHLDHEAQQADAARGDLDQAMHNATSRAASLQQSGTEFQKATGGLGTQLQQTAASLEKALEQAGQACEEKQKDLSRRADDMKSAAAGAATALAAQHQAVGAAFEQSKAARASYLDHTNQHHAVSHQFLSDGQAQLGNHYSKFEGGAHSARGQFATMTGELDQHLQGSVAPASQASSNFLANDLKNSLSTMVQQRLHSTMEQLKGYQTHVQTVDGELAGTARATVTVIQELTGEFPGKVMNMVGNPILLRVENLVANQVINLGETIAGASISAATAGAFPVLKVIERSLKLLLHVVNYAQTGQLLADDPGAYEDISATRARLAQAGATGKGAEGGLAHLIDQGIVQLDDALVGVQVAATSTAAMVQHVAQQALEAGEEFIQSILCPLCGTECVPDQSGEIDSSGQLIGTGA
ncbi:MAG: hypothetical protein KF760_28705 [Candidatus Eremiobacteraeota bacterium]|nr:hypothetical protein [Candidatus Eremiobacteraeota bacterium]MCW5865877.1 hypothetical protein [Candidatus Eremiobacteraeota bacterium]